jgi:SnoaL-like domain
MNAPPADVAVELQNLHQRYAVLTDQGRGEELAELFTADIVWDGDDLGYGRAEGAAAAVENVIRHFDPARPMMHLPGPLLLTAVADDEVLGTSWCMATRWVDGQARPVIYFQYDDVFRRGDDGAWRFARRLLRLRGR